MEIVVGAKAVQVLLNQLGFGPLTVDGKPGSLTMAAVIAALATNAPIGEPVTDKVDDRSERMIATLLPRVQDIARQFILQCNANHIPARITSGYRTYDQQNALYEQGRTEPGNIVTGARGGYSWHNFAVAFDITLFDPKGMPIWDSPLYKHAGDLGKSLGLEWGGDWTFEDDPHFQFNPKRLTLADARQLHDTGRLSELTNHHGQQTT